MTKEADLFTKSAFDEVVERGVEVYETTRIKYGARVKLLDFAFNAVDMLNTLEAVEDGGVTVDANPFGDFLVKIGVLESLGSQRWMASATTGPNFKAFKAKLEAEMRKLPHYDVLEE